MNRVGSREWGRRDGETERRRDGETERKRGCGKFRRRFSLSPHLSVSLSLCLSISRHLRQPEITTEPLARIEPHARGCEAGRLGQGSERFEVVLVGIFGVYRLARFKLDLQRGLRFGAADIDYLLSEADQMDFYAALSFIEKGAVFELSEVEVGVQIAVDAHQQIPAEGRRQVERVVIGLFERFA